MKRFQNFWLIAAVVLLAAIPLVLVKRPPAGLDGKEVEIFNGSDDQAKDLIGKIKPDYKPWFTPIMEPPSGEVSSLLFALQAALGAGFIGYYLGSAATRAKLQKELNQPPC
jgi:cobalt/nickel transport protein